MGPKQDLVLIDTNIFVIDLRYTLPSPDLKNNFPDIGLSELFDLLRDRTALGDALMIAVARKHLPFVSKMITWDKEHFDGKFPGTVLTPKEFMQRTK